MPIAVQSMRSLLPAVLLLVSWDAPLVAVAAMLPVGEAMRGLYTRRIRLAVELVERATERGQLRSGTDPILLLDQLAGALYYRVLITGMPVDDPYLVRLVGAALDGAMSPKEHS